MEGMSYEEIAKVLGISKNKVKNIEERALKKLKVPTEKNKRFWEYLKEKASEDRECRFLG
jgi:DNA-directed RNA polymerase sigma subunit (sigma70/sigma32)